MQQWRAHVSLFARFDKMYSNSQRLADSGGSLDWSCLLIVPYVLAYPLTWVFKQFWGGKKKVKVTKAEQLVKHVCHGNQAAAEAMLKAYPHLVLGKQCGVGDALISGVCDCFSCTFLALS